MSRRCGGLSDQGCRDRLCGPPMAWRFSLKTLRLARSAVYGFGERVLGTSRQAPFRSLCSNIRPWPHGSAVTPRTCSSRWSAVHLTATSLSWSTPPGSSTCCKRLSTSRCKVCVVGSGPSMREAVIFREHDRRPEPPIQASASAHVVPVSAPGVRLRRFVRDSLLDGDGFELPVPLATERLSCQLDALGLGGVLFRELGFGLTNHQDREGDGCQHSEAEQHPVEKAGPAS